jgi:hypothetical protein
MALTKVGKEGVVGLDNSADATAINITSGENVGIGVVPETTWNSNIDALQLGLGASIYGDNTATGLQISANTVATLGSSLNGYKYIGSDKASTYQQYDGEHNFRVASSGSADGAITWSTAMTINNTGAITKPLQPAFLALTSSTIDNFAVATATTIAFGGEIFDQNADYNNSTYTFTAPVTGKYQLNVLLILHNLDSASSYYQTQLITSNRTYYHLVDTDYGQDNTYQNLNVNILADMDANDTAIVKVYQASGTQQSDIDGTSSFSGYLVA